MFSASRLAGPFPRRPDKRGILAFSECTEELSHNDTRADGVINAIWPRHYNSRALIAL